jgi:hypothetical protein
MLFILSELDPPMLDVLKYSALRSRRLTVRTPGFHPGNRGSIPRGITMLLFYLLFISARGAN